MTSAVRLWSYLCAALIVASLTLPTSPLLAAEDEAEAEPKSGAAEFSEVSIPIMAVTLGAILMDGDWRATDAARYSLDAMLSAQVAAEALKRIVKQPRPCDPESEDGFPSGHTAVAFAFAHSLSDWKPGAAPAFYAFAATCGWARVKEGKHTWGQVLAGAALGALTAELSVNTNGGILQGTIAPSQHTAMLEFRPSLLEENAGYTVWDTRW